MSDLISRQAAIDEVKRLHDVAWTNWKETKISANTMIDALKDLPSAEPEDWIERNKERILQAGMEGREIEFRIGGRLFAIREKAQ